MSVRDELLKEISKQRKSNSLKQKFEGNFLDYVEMVKENPDVTKSAHKRLYEAISEHGMEKMQIQIQERKRYSITTMLKFMTISRIISSAWKRCWLNS